jgi:hypothetical protein
VACAVAVALAYFGLVLTLAHPNQKARFLHSWLPMVWVLGGVGVGRILGKVRPLAVRRVLCIATVLLSSS